MKAMTMKRHHILAAMAVAAAALPLQAQELHESFYVEGEYIPDVIKREKIHALPEKVSFGIDVTPPAFARKGVVTPYSPYLQALPPFGWRTDRLSFNKRGYVDFGSGSYLNTVGSAGYRVVDGSDTKVDLMLQHNSTSLMKKRFFISDLYNYRRRYDETIALHATHSHSTAGTFSADASWHLGWFNYYNMSSAMPDVLGGDAVWNAPTQTLNDASVSVGWTNSFNNGISAGAAVGYRYFGYRRYYASAVDNDPMKGTREGDLWLQASVRYGFNASSGVELGARGNFLFYSLDKRLGFDGGKADYGNVSLTPAYTFNLPDLSVRLGVRADFTFNAGKQALGVKREFKSAHIAPDVEVQWAPSRVFGIRLDAGGGTRLNTLASLHALDYYSAPALMSTLPSYSPADVSLMFMAGPWSGFSFRAGAGYAFTRNTPLGGTYMVSPALRHESGMENMPDAFGLTVKGYRLMAGVTADTGRWFRFEGDVTWSDQNGEKGWFNGFDRARWTGRLSATTSPLENLDVTLSYDFRLVRQCYMRALFAEPEAPEQYVSSLVRLPLRDLTMLNIGASYRILPTLNVFVSANNLLCHRVDFLPGIKGEGFNIMGGFGVDF